MPSRPLVGEWHVERPWRPVCWHGVLTDARLVRGRAKQHLSYSGSSCRVDLTCDVKDLSSGQGRHSSRCYWHRVVAFAWHGPAGKFQDVGGEWKDFPEPPSRMQDVIDAEGVPTSG